MQYRNLLVGLVLICLSIVCTPSQVCGQNSYFDVNLGNSSEVVDYNHIPAAIVAVTPNIPAAYYHWEQSPTPNPADFTRINNATESNYTFNAPLQQTTYFRRAARFGINSTIYL